MKNDCIIRLETSKDHAKVEHLVRESFWNVYRPGCLEHYVLHCLREDPAFVPELDFVMEKDGVIIGQNIFVRASIAADDGRSIPILTMGPICIASELKRQLAVVNGKLDNLQTQNEALRAELARLKQEK